MSSWKWNLIEGTTFLILGILLLVYNYWNIEAIDFENIGGKISASLNPTFSILLIIGFFFVGVGTAQSAVTITIYKLDRNSINN
ncbi:MAG: hypothetical protein P8Y18_09755 [Candidatus Bathyarchaeota archaeon]